MWVWWETRWSSGKRPCVIHSWSVVPRRTSCFDISIRDSIVQIEAFSAWNDSESCVRIFRIHAIVYVLYAIWRSNESRRHGRWCNPSEIIQNIILRVTVGGVVESIGSQILPVSTISKEIVYANVGVYDRFTRLALSEKQKKLRSNRDLQH